MKKEMFKFLKTLIKFIPFAFIIYAIFISLWGEFMPELLKKNLKYNIAAAGHTFSRLKEAKEIENVDILFIGSSHTYRGFDNRIFQKAGLKTFNLGSSSQTPIQTLALLNRYLDRLNPKTIIFEVYPITFTIDGVESSLDIIANDKNDFESIKMAFKQNHIKVYNSLIYGFYRDIFGRNSSIQEAAQKIDDKYISGGYVETKIKCFKHKDYKKQSWNFKDAQFKSFQSIIENIKARKIKLILVQAPITQDLYNSYTNNIDFDNRMKTYGDYYNFNNIVALDDSLHFYDSNHLNQNGVDIFNKKLIEVCGF
jgi:hypothetical protein